jgi:hypothetical protein
MAEPQPPQNLFMRILRRLGLERQLQLLRRHLGAVIAGLAVSFVFAAWAVHILVQVLRWSSFGPFARLALTDPIAMARFRSLYILSILESIPALEVALFFASLAAVLLLVRWLTRDVDTYQDLAERINEQHYEH